MLFYLLFPKPFPIDEEKTLWNCLRKKLKLTLTTSHLKLMHIMVNEITAQNATNVNFLYKLIRESLKQWIMIKPITIISRLLTIPRNCCYTVLLPTFPVLQILFKWGNIICINTLLKRDSSVTQYQRHNIGPWS